MDTSTPCERMSARGVPPMALGRQPCARNHTVLQRCGRVNVPISETKGEAAYMVCGATTQQSDAAALRRSLRFGAALMWERNSKDTASHRSVRPWRKPHAGDPSEGQLSETARARHRTPSGGTRFQRRPYRGDAHPGSAGCVLKHRGCLSSAPHRRHISSEWRRHRRSGAEMTSGDVVSAPTSPPLKRASAVRCTAQLSILIHS